MILLGCSVDALLARRWLQMLFWASVMGVLTMSLMPLEYLPPRVFDWWDKAQHALGFAWLALCGRLAYPRWPRGMLVVLLVLGAVIEWVQSATGWRQGDVADWCADAIGVFAVWCLFSCDAPSCSKTVESPPPPR